MNHILVSLGFKHLETLKEFSLRFPNLSTWPGDDLDKIWICHKTNPLNFDVENLPNECDYENLISYFKKTNNFNDETSECIANSVLNKIYEYFKCPAATYILKECHLFYNWGTYSFEIICGHNEIYQSINGCKSRLCPSNTFSQTLDNTSLEPVAKNAHFIKKGKD